MSVDRSAFDPLDLEIIDRVYEAALAHLLVRFPDLNPEVEAKRQDNLRKRLFALAHAGKVDFDTLYNMVVSSYDVPISTTLLNHGARIERAGERPYIGDSGGLPSPPFPSQVPAHPSRNREKPVRIRGFSFEEV